MSAHPAQEPLEFVALPWVVVECPGTDDEDVLFESASRREAEKCMGMWRSSGHTDIDLMKRQPDGSLTTEF